MIEKIDNKFSVLTNKVNDSHTAIINIAPEDINITLHPAKSHNDAIKKCTEWINSYKKKGSLSTNKVFDRCYKHYPDLFPNRVSVIDHLFFVIGTEYKWLDGCLINTNPSSHLPSKMARKEDTAIEKVLNNIRKLSTKNYGVEYDDYHSFNIKRWEADRIAFYPVSKQFSNICLIPDNIKPSWLKVVYEAALWLKDKSGIPDIKSKYNDYSDADVQIMNCKIGEEVFANLNERFNNE